MFLEEKKKETVDYLADQIASSFSLLANIEPNAALDVLNQMNETEKSKSIKKEKWTIL